MAKDPTQTSAAKFVRQYKTILQNVLQSRPSGTRQRLATALGTNRSFISQIANPAYKIPIPAQHVGTILEVCHFSAAEQAAFTEIYSRAHPDEAALREEALGIRVISVAVPDLGKEKLNKIVDDAIRDMANSIRRIHQKAYDGRRKT